MKRPPVLDNEQKRLEELNSYAILDTLPEEDFDNLTAIASQVCGTHISLVSLVDIDRQWFKSHHGISTKETPVEHSFCAHAITQPNEIFIVEDAREDKRFHNNPLVTGSPSIVFYAGVPLISENGLPLGSLCVIHDQPKKLSDDQINALKALSKQVMSLIDLRRKRQQLEDTFKQLRERNQELEKFAYLAAHDLKSPLASIAVLTKMLMASSGSKLDPVANGQLEMIQKSAERLKSLVDGLLDYNTCLDTFGNQLINVDLKDFEMEIRQAFASDPIDKMTWDTQIDVIRINHAALKHILTELIHNAIRYNFDELTKIEVSITEDSDNYIFRVKDNGSGIAKKDHQRIFEVFQVAQIPDRFDEIGNGIGLATVRKILDYLGGEVTVNSEEGQGSEFTFSMNK